MSSSKGLVEVGWKAYTVIVGENLGGVESGPPNSKKETSYE
jgi:hypothetical protein